MGRRDIRWEIKTIGKSKVPVIPREFKDNSDPQWQIDQRLNCTEEECHPYGKCQKIDRRKKKMSDKEYIKYLSKWLRFDSGEDCCARCAYGPKTKLCPNWTKSGRLKSKQTCYDGMREYANKKRSD